MKKPREALKTGFSWVREDPGALRAKGTYILDLKDSRTGELLDHRELSNIVTLDASILTAMFYSMGPNPSPSLSGLTMLAMGTGATGSLLNPDAPDPRQRQLNSEVSLGRKPFVTRQYRTATGAVASVPTNIADFTTTFGEGEAVGPLNEMGLLRTISQNPSVRTPITPSVVFPAYDTTVNLSTFDVLANYTTFSVVSKPSTSVLTITWRLTF
jgi:hypothetical protein